MLKDSANQSQFVVGGLAGFVGGDGGGAPGNSGRWWKSCHGRRGKISCAASFITMLKLLCTTSLKLDVGINRRGKVDLLVVGELGGQMESEYPPFFPDAATRDSYPDAHNHTSSTLRPSCPSTSNFRPSCPSTSNFQGVQPERNRRSRIGGEAYGFVKMESEIARQIKIKKTFYKGVSSSVGH
jgi:hypothetical protein